MVRSLVGAMLAVGEQPARTTAWWRNAVDIDASAQVTLRRRRRTGLTLIGVDYPPDDELEARTKVTRDLRTR